MTWPRMLEFDTDEIAEVIAIEDCGFFLSLGTQEKDRYRRMAEVAILRVYEKLDASTEF